MDEQFRNNADNENMQNDTSPANKEQESQSAPNPQNDEGKDAANKKQTTSKTWLIAGAVIIAVIIIALALYSVSGGGLSQSGSRVVASVNGQTITQSELDKRFDQSTQALKARGSNISKQQKDQLKQQILQSLVNEKLLVQAAKDAGVSVPSKDVQDRINQVQSQFKDAEEFESKLKENNLTMEEFKSTIRKQLLVQGYLDDNMSTSSITVTDADVQEQYDQITQRASSSQQQVPPLSQIRPMLEQQIKQQKLQKQRQSIIDELRKSADIEKKL